MVLSSAPWVSSLSQPPTTNRRYRAVRPILGLGERWTDLPPPEPPPPPLALLLDRLATDPLYVGWSGVKLPGLRGLGKLRPSLSASKDSGEAFSCSALFGGCSSSLSARLRPLLPPDLPDGSPPSSPITRSDLPTASTVQPFCSSLFEISSAGQAPCFPT